MTVAFRQVHDKTFPNTHVSKIIISKFHEDTIPDILHQMQAQNNQLQVNWLRHPLDDLTSLQDNTTFAYFEISSKLNALIANKGTLAQQIEYLSLMGVPASIERSPNWKTALTFHKFCAGLSKLGINNPPIASLPEGSIKRIHAVHHQFLNDNEISSGLSIAYNKNKEGDLVLYVCSPETLDLAISVCAPKSKLTIDGHWEHAKKSEHGVWDVANAEQIAVELTDLLQKYPNKITAINLLGCEAGYMSPFEDMPISFDENSLQFKDETNPNFKNKEMSLFRNRATYISKSGEFPYAKNSLAGQIILKLNNPNVSVTASSGYTYPFPAENALFNIGSDCPEWKGEHRWNEENTSAPIWYKKLKQSKVTTCSSSFFAIKDEDTKDYAEVAQERSCSSVNGDKDSSTLVP